MQQAAEEAASDAMYAAEDTGAEAPVETETEASADAETSSSQ
ncbi:hypothetical protein [Halomonas aquatica]|uniref:Uncharacterized protein n=1 Tax=Halomonas aquatica TaxID=3151123 RepID=A0ABV1NB25_9GAMM